MSTHYCLIKGTISRHCNNKNFNVTNKKSRMYLFLHRALSSFSLIPNKVVKAASGPGHSNHFTIIEFDLGSLCSQMKTIPVQCPYYSGFI